MLPKAHLTSLSRMSGSRWVIKPLWLSGSWRYFLYSSSVYSCHLFLISSASVRSIPFLSFIVPIFAWNILLASVIFLKRSLVFSILYYILLFLCIDHWGRLSYLSLLFFGTLHWNGYIFPFLLCLSLLFFSQIFVRPHQTTILPFCITFLWELSWPLTHVQCHEPPSIFLQTLCISDLIPWICLPLPLYNHKGFDLGHTCMTSGFLEVFPTVFNLHLNLAIRSSWFEPQSASCLVFADCIELFHLLLQRVLSIWFHYWPSGDVHV